MKASSRGMTANDEIELEYGHLGDGERLAGQLCPYCRGGRSGERTLSVGRVGAKLVYRCHRASCGRSGATGSGSFSPSSGERGSSRAGRGTPRTEELPSEIGDSLCRSYSINESEQDAAGLRFVPDSGRLFLPVRDRLGNLKGYTTRSLDGTGPKSLRFVDNQCRAWYPNPYSKILVIVEDQLSAIRASSKFNAVALLGTHMTTEDVMEIRRAGYEQVVLLLDNDAFDKAVRYVVEFRPLLRMTTHKLPKDIKNMTEEEWSFVCGSLQIG